MTLWRIAASHQLVLARLPPGYSAESRGLAGGRERLAAAPEAEGDLTGVPARLRQATVINPSTHRSYPIT